MAKTKRTKHNAKAPIKSRNIQLVKVRDGQRKKANKDALVTHVGLTLTGVNRGKVYPYRSTKRGGTAPARLAPRTIVGRVKGAAKAVANAVLGP